MNIRPHTVQDDAAVVAILHDVFPSRPVLSADEFRAEIESMPPEVPSERLVVEDDRQIVAFAAVMQQYWTGKSDSYRAMVVVSPAQQGGGIGSALAKRLLVLLQAHGARQVYVEVREDDTAARQFAAARGCVETGHIVRHTRLHVDKANLEGYDDLAQRLWEAGITVQTLAELGPADEQLLRAVHDVSMRTAADEPSPEPYDVTFEQWHTMITTTPGLSAETIWVALDGRRPIGLTMLRRQGVDSGFHFSMGVERDYRGRGVARLLKLRQIEWARTSGVSMLYTANDSNNPRMYDINVRLGYQPLPAMINLVLSLQDPAPTP